MEIRIYIYIYIFAHVYRTYHSFNWKGLEFCWTQNWAETPASDMDSAVYVDFCSLAPLVQKTRPQLKIENSEVSCWNVLVQKWWTLINWKMSGPEAWTHINVFNVKVTKFPSSLICPRNKSVYYLIIIIITTTPSILTLQNWRFCEDPTLATQVFGPFQEGGSFLIL